MLTLIMTLAYQTLNIEMVLEVKVTLSLYRTEECDDSNLLDGDGCSKKCHKEMGFNCNGERVLLD